MLVNDKRGEFLVKTADGTKKIRFKSEHLCQAEKHLGGVSVLAVLSNSEKLGFSAIRALLHAGLQGAGNRWTLEAVGKNMLMSELTNYIETIIEAFQAATGIGVGADEEQSEDEEERVMDPTEIPGSANNA